MKENAYNIKKYSVQELECLIRSVNEYATPIGGLPQNSHEVFDKRGWLLPYLLAYDDLLWKRWSYWLEIKERGTIEGSSPIPQIKWSDRHDLGVQEAFKMLRRCLSHHESKIDLFADWLLWGFSATFEEPKISKELNDHYYRHFDLFLVQRYPTDYFSSVLSEETGKGYKEALGYFPTPFNVALMMTHLLFEGEDQEILKKKTLYEPCVGCGSLLLPASNYCLKAYGTDVSLIAIKLCKIQMYWYAPWFALPDSHIQGFDDDMIRLSDDKNVPEGQQMLAIF